MKGLNRFAVQHNKRWMSRAYPLVSIPAKSGINRKPVRNTLLWCSGPAAICLLHMGQDLHSRHSLLEVLLIAEDLLLVGVLLLGLCPLDDGSQDDHIYHQRNNSHNALRSGVRRRGTNCGVH